MPSVCLCEPAAARGKANNGTTVGDGSHRGVDDIRTQHHARATAEWRVIDGAMPIVGKVADVDDVQPTSRPLPKPGRQRLTKRPGKHGGKQRQDGGRQIMPLASSADDDRRASCSFGMTTSASSGTIISSGRTATNRRSARSTVGTQAAVNGISTVRRGRELDTCASPVVMHCSDDADRATGSVDDSQTDQIGQIIFIMIRRRQSSTIDEQLDVSQLFRLRAIRYLNRNPIDNSSDLSNAFGLPAHNIQAAFPVRQRSISGQVGRVGGIARDLHQPAHTMCPTDHA